jgi:hypothetical protein
MKILLFYHIHRQLEEIYYSSLFFNKSEFLKSNCDVYVSCNNKNISLHELEKNCKFKAKTNMAVTTKNAGYSFGQVEAESDTFEMWREYEYVIFCQPDCYITTDEHLKKAFESSFDALVSPIFHIGRTCYTGDFIVLKPTVNLFRVLKSYYSETNDRNHPHEHYLADRINETYSNIKTFDRVGHRERVIDTFGLWHEHNNNNVRKVLGI